MTAGAMELHVPKFPKDARPFSYYKLASRDMKEEAFIVLVSWIRIFL
jgi:hypothetical protein